MQQQTFREEKITACTLHSCALCSTFRTVKFYQRLIASNEAHIYLFAHKRIVIIIIALYILCIWLLLMLLPRMFIATIIIISAAKIEMIRTIYK